MIVGHGNYLYMGGRYGFANSRSKKSKVFLIKHHNNVLNSKGLINIGVISFPAHCIGKRVRIKVEFIDEPLKVLDNNDKLVEPIVFEVKHY